MKTGIELISEERKRQIEKEGWTSTHDNQHVNNELAIVASLYALPNGQREITVRSRWPETWDYEWWKPTPENRVKELQKAGALIAAEIDRIQSQQKTIKSFELEDTTDNLCNYCGMNIPDCAARIRFGNHHTGDNIAGCDSYDGPTEDMYINEKEYTEEEFNKLYED
ncbi:MAG: hypothetical protein WCK78_04325 [Paludibacter sp.]